MSIAEQVLYKCVIIINTLPYLIVPHLTSSQLILSKFTQQISTEQLAILQSIGSVVIGLHNL